MEKRVFKTAMLIILSIMVIVSVRLLYLRETIFFGNYAYGSGAIFYNFYLTIFFLIAVVGVSAQRTWGWTFTQAHLGLLLLNLIISSYVLKSAFIYILAAFILLMMISLFIKRKEFYLVN